jgi:hypothetical protein
MDAEKVALSTELCCLECRQLWVDPSERWRMYTIFGEEPEHGLYCPVCASFEFGD